MLDSELMSGMPCIALSGMGLAFNGRSLFKDLAISLGRGETLTVSGPSGCGKSSLLQCLLGFVEPTAGTIAVFGEKLDGHSVWALRRHMAYVAQEPDLGRGRVGDAILAPLAFHANRHVRDSGARVGELLDRFGLSPGILEKDLADISGGEKQRVALVSALLLDRDILLVDEITSALDRGARERVSGFVRSLRHTTVVAVCHDPSDLGLGGHVLTLGDREP